MSISMGSLAPKALVSRFLRGWNFACSAVNSPVEKWKITQGDEGSYPC